MTGCVKGSKVGGRTRKEQGTANKLLFKFSKISHLRRFACRGKGTARWSQSRRRSQRSWGWSPCDGPIFLEEERCRRFWSPRRLHHTPRRIFLGPVVKNMLLKKKLLETKDQVFYSTHIMNVENTARNSILRVNTSWEEFAKPNTNNELKFFIRFWYERNPKNIFINQFIGYYFISYLDQIIGGTTEKHATWPET